MSWEVYKCWDHVHIAFFARGQLPWTKQVLSAALAKSGPLDFQSEKIFFYFLPMKMVKDTCFKNSLFVLQLSFFASPQAKNDFWPDHPCEQRSKVSISKILSSAQRLQQFSSRNSILLQVTRCIQLVHRQNMETSAEIFFIPAWSEETLLFDLNLHIKNSLLYTKEFSNCRR